MLTVGVTIYAFKKIQEGNNGNKIWFSSSDDDSDAGGGSGRGGKEAEEEDNMNKRSSWFGFALGGGSQHQDKAKEEAARLTREADIRQLLEAGTQKEVLEQLYKPEEVAKCIDQFEKEKLLLQFLEEEVLHEAEAEEAAAAAAAEAQSQGDVNEFAGDDDDDEDNAQDPPPNKDDKEQKKEDNSVPAVDNLAITSDDEDDNKNDSGKDNLRNSNHSLNKNSNHSLGANKFRLRFDSADGDLEGDDNVVTAHHATADTQDDANIGADPNNNSTNTLEVDAVSIGMDSVGFGDEEGGDPTPEQPDVDAEGQDSEDDLLKELLNTEGEESSNFDDSVTTTNENAPDGSQHDGGEAAADATSAENVVGKSPVMTIIDTSAIDNLSGSNYNNDSSNHVSELGDSNYRSASRLEEGGQESGVEKDATTEKIDSATDDKQTEPLMDVEVDDKMEAEAEVDEAAVAMSDGEGDDAVMDSRELMMETTSVEDDEELSERSPKPHVRADEEMKDSLGTPTPEDMDAAEEIEEVTMNEPPAPVVEDSGHVASSKAGSSSSSESSDEEDSTPLPPPPVDVADAANTGEEEIIEEEVVLDDQEDVIEQIVDDDNSAGNGEEFEEIIDQEGDDPVIGDEYEEVDDDEEEVEEVESGEEEEEVVEEGESAEEESVESEGSYADQVVESWNEVIEEQPEDLEAAVSALIAVVYKDEDVDVESMLRRTRLPELYKYLKSQYWYKIHTNQEVSAPLEAKQRREKPTEMLTVDEMLKGRLQGLIANVQHMEESMHESRRLPPEDESNDKMANESVRRESQMQNIIRMSSRNLMANENKRASISGNNNMLGGNNEEEEEEDLFDRPDGGYLDRSTVSKLSSEHRDKGKKHHVAKYYEKAVNNRAQRYVPSKAKKEELKEEANHDSFANATTSDHGVTKEETAPNDDTAKDVEKGGETAIQKDDSEEPSGSAEIEAPSADEGEKQEVIEKVELAESGEREEAIEEQADGEEVEEVIEDDEEEELVVEDDEEEEVVVEDGEEEVVVEDDEEEELVEGEEEVQEVESGEEILDDDGGVVEEEILDDNDSVVEEEILDDNDSVVEEEILDDDGHDEEELVDDEDGEEFVVDDYDEELVSNHKDDAPWCPHQS